MEVENITSDEKLVTLQWVACRWSVSRSTAQRILVRARVSPFFLSGIARGVRRYKSSDVTRVEESARGSPEPQ